ncbi:MAG: glycosyl transferase family 1 [Flavobacteriaceae bacterium]|nr:glycosyl transferase family 1 [Flavobacteriaceae bacterium]
MRKKALIIAYYWPPAGGPGVQRWLKFVKYLRHFGVEPIVYVPENPSYPIVDDNLLSEVPKDISILKQPIKEPYRVARLFSKKSAKTISRGIIHKTKQQSLIERTMLYVRGNFFIPDARKNWVNPSVNFLYNYIVENDIDTIITTGPPHSLHLIGMELKIRLKLRWFADFRDPWTTIGYHKKLKLTKTSLQKHKTLEKKVLMTADQIIVTSPTTKVEFEAITNQPIEVITNGYDYEHITPPKLDTVFSIAHIGSLLSDRNPKVLWQVLKDLIVENTAFRQDFKLDLVGAVSEEIVATIKDFNLESHLNLVGYVSHEDAIIYQRKSQVLLLIEIDSDETKCIIPGKLFEYMISNRPIIAIGPKDADIKSLVKDTNTGKYFSYNDYDCLKFTILEYFNAFKAGHLKSFPVGLQRYSRKTLTEKLARLILKE